MRVIKTIVRRLSRVYVCARARVSISFKFVLTTKVPSCVISFSLKSFFRTVCQRRRGKVKKMVTLGYTGRKFVAAALNDVGMIFSRSEIKRKKSLWKLKENWTTIRDLSFFVASRSRSIWKSPQSSRIREQLTR